MSKDGARYHTGRAKFLQKAEICNRTYLPVWFVGAQIVWKGLLTPRTVYGIHNRRKSWDRLEIWHKITMLEKKKKLGSTKATETLSSDLFILGPQAWSYCLIRSFNASNNPRYLFID